LSRGEHLKIPHQNCKLIIFTISTSEKHTGLSLTRGIQRRRKPIANGSFHLRKSNSKLLDIACCREIHAASVAEIFKVSSCTMRPAKIQNAANFHPLMATPWWRAGR
jgi:hypothetical protein